MTAYADYAYYTGTFLGTTITEVAFPQLALRASAVIDQITFGRAAVDVAANTNVTAIKNAMCAVAEELLLQATQPDGITSESQGQYSVSFATNSSKSQTNQAKLEKAARLWLANTSLLYAGFHNGEYGGESDSE